MFLQLFFNTISPSSFSATLFSSVYSSFVTLFSFCVLPYRGRYALRLRNGASAAVYRLSWNELASSWLIYETGNILSQPLSRHYPVISWTGRGKPPTTSGCSAVRSILIRSRLARSAFRVHCSRHYVISAVSYRTGTAPI
jgi:hypothetical protein